MYTCTAFRATMQQEWLQTACAIHALLSQPSAHSLTFVSLLADAIQAPGRLTRFAQVAVSRPQATVSFQDPPLAQGLLGFMWLSKNSIDS